MVEKARVKNDYETVPAFLLLAVIALGIALRIPQINYSFFGDESFSVLRDANRWLTTSEDRFRPLFFTLLYFWKQLGFHGEVGLRLLPLLFGIAQIPMAYLVGKELLGRRLGLTFSVLIAANPMLIEFSQELRMYSLVALIALVQVWVLLKILNRDEKAQETRLWIWFVLLGVFGVYVHLHYWIFLAGMTLTLLRERRAIALWKSAVALGAMLLLYLPNIPNIIEFQKVRGGEYQMDFASAMPKVFAAFSVGFNYFKLPEEGIGRPVGLDVLRNNWWLFILAAIPALLILWRLIGLNREVAKPRDEQAAENERLLQFRTYMLGHELFTVPVLLAFLASAVTGKYFLQPKYIIFASPFALLLLAQIFLSFHYPALRKIIIVFGVGILTVATVHFNMPADYGRRENWRHAAEVLESELTPNSTLLLLGNAYPLLDYYGSGTRSYWNPISIPANNPQPAVFAVPLLERLAHKTDIYYLRFDTAQNLMDPRDLTLQSMSLVAKQVGVIQFNPRLKLYHWRMRTGEGG